MFCFFEIGQYLTAKNWLQIKTRNRKKHDFITQFKCALEKSPNNEASVSKKPATRPGTTVTLKCVIKIMKQPNKPARSDEEGRANFPRTSTYRGPVRLDAPRTRPSSRVFGGILDAVARSVDLNPAHIALNQRRIAFGV